MNRYLIQMLKEFNKLIATLMSTSIYTLNHWISNLQFWGTEVNEWNMATQCLNFGFIGNFSTPPLLTRCKMYKGKGVPHTTSSILLILLVNCIVWLWIVEKNKCLSVIILCRQVRNVVCMNIPSSIRTTISNSIFVITSVTDH